MKKKTVQKSIMSPQAHKGIVAALGACGLWGLLPLYWNLLGHLPAFEILCHRILWSAVILFFAVRMLGYMPALRAVVSDKRTLGLLCVSAVLISINWFLFIWAVGEKRVIDSSLGYYINPLMSALIGYCFFGERCGRLQGFGIFLAVLGVGWNVVAHGSLPLLSLGVALSFTLYSAVRKITRVDPLCALLVETLLTTPMALVVLGHSFTTAGMPDSHTILLLTLAGPFTLVPLLCFGYAAQRIRLTVLGLCQYLSPTLSFLCSIFVLHEPFSRTMLVTFVIIWAGLAVFTWASWRAVHGIRS